jgi:hypothetical protein
LTISKEATLTDPYQIISTVAAALCEAHAQLCVEQESAIYSDHEKNVPLAKALVASLEKAGFAISSNTST